MPSMTYVKLKTEVRANGTEDGLFARIPPLGLLKLANSNTSPWPQAQQNQDLSISAFFTGDSVCGLTAVASRRRQRAARMASSSARLATCRLAIGSSTKGQSRPAGGGSGLLGGRRARVIPPG